MKLVLFCIALAVLALGTEARAPSFAGRVPTRTRAAFRPRQQVPYGHPANQGRQYADPGPFASDAAPNMQGFDGPEDEGNAMQFDNPYSGPAAPGYPNARPQMDPYMSEFAERSATYSRHASRNRFRSMEDGEEEVAQGAEGGGSEEAAGEAGAPAEEEIQPPEEAPPGDASEAPPVESEKAQAAAAAIPAGLSPATIQRDAAFSDTLPKLRAEPVLARDEAPKKRDEPDPELDGSDDAKKLQVAMDAVNEDIMVKVNQIKDADAWEKELATILEVYSKKMDTVRRNLGKAKEDVKSLTKKKAQFMNLKIQMGLEAKLRAANSELTELTEAIANVKAKETEFDKSKTAIANSIANLETQIKTLKGEDASEAPKPADAAAAKPADAAAPAAAPAEADKVKFAEKAAATAVSTSAALNTQHHSRRLDVSAEELEDTRHKLEAVREMIRVQKEKIRKVENEEFERAKRAKHFRDRFTPNNHQ